MPRRAPQPSQSLALFYVVLLLTNGCQATRLVASVRIDEGAERTMAEWSFWGSSSSDTQQAQQAQPDSTEDGEEIVDDSVAEEAVWRNEQLKDPNEPLTKWSNMNKWSDRFKRFSGFGRHEAEEKYAKAVREILPDMYIHESAQFALCARVSSSASQEEFEGITLSCSPVLNLLAVDAEQDPAGRLNLKDVWKGLRDLVDNVKVPNINWSNDWMANTWRSMTNWATGKKDRFIREQTVDDGWFEEYFEAETRATSFSFIKESIKVQKEKVQKLLQFDSASGGKKINFQSDTYRNKKWPGENAPSMGSRYLLCFGQLSYPNSDAVDPANVAENCAGFWNKDMTKSAIIGLGKSLAGSDYRDEAIFNARMEILYGVGKSDGLKSLFSVATSAPSAKALGKTIARLVRTRIVKNGLQVNAYAANAAGVRAPGSNSFIQVDSNSSDALTADSEVTPWININPYTTGTWTLTLENGVLVSATQAGAAGGATAGAGGAAAGAGAGIVIGGVTVSPAIIVVGIIAAFYILKNLKSALWKKYLTQKKLKKWQNLLTNKHGYRISCFVNATTLTKVPDRGRSRCPAR